MLVFVKARERLARDARQHAVERFDKCHFAIELAQDSRRFEPDIAAADDDRAF